jgi:hypothetical protein
LPTVTKKSALPSPVASPAATIWVMLSGAGAFDDSRICWRLSMSDGSSFEVADITDTPQAPSERASFFNAQ